MTRLASVPWVFLVSLAACSNLLPGPLPDPAPDAGGPRTTHLLISPSQPQALRIEGGAAAKFRWQAFLVVGETGERSEVTERCFWSVVPRSGQRMGLGTIDKGQFESEPQTAGVGEVRAELGDLRASVPMTISLRAAHLSGADDGSAPPADAAARFGGTQSAGRAPTVLYPPDGAVLQQGVGGLRVQFSAQGGTSLHEVSLRGETLDLRVYTTSPRRLSLSETEYTLLTDAALFGPVTLRVRGTATSGDTSVGESAPLVLRAAPPITGVVYYFAARMAGGGNPAQGLWRFPFTTGLTGAPVPYATDRNTTLGGRCVGCHAAAPDGAFLSLSFDRDTPQPGGILSVRDARPFTVGSGAQWYYSAVAADERRVLVAEGGRLSLLTTDTGITAEVIPTATPAGMIDTMPVLSADTRTVVYVRGRAVAGQAESHVQQGSIVRQQKSGDTWGAPVVLVQQSGTENNYYPALSPDGRFVIFTRAAGDSFDNPGASLWTVPLDGSRGALPLTQASTAFAARNTAVRTDATNSYARFYATPVTIPAQGGAGDRTVYYFVFSSRRDYGVEISHTGAGARDTQARTRVLGQATPGGDSTLTGWNHQLWLSTFDPALAAEGKDPSTPATWLHFQSQLQSNHTPLFTSALGGPDLP